MRHPSGLLASAISGSNPLRGKIWIVQTPGRSNGPWPMFKRLAKRNSSKEIQTQ